MTDEETAQTIAEIKERHGSQRKYSAWQGMEVLKDRATLLKIVDSQSKKLSEQAAEIERLKKFIDEWGLNR